MSLGTRWTQSRWESNIHLEHVPLVLFIFDFPSLNTFSQKGHFMALQGNVLQGNNVLCVKGGALVFPQRSTAHFLGETLSEC